MFAIFSELHQYRELIWNLVVRNLKIRYKGSALGFFWTLVNPLFMMAIYLFFIRLMRFEMNLAVLLVGLIPWQFLIMCLNDSVESITGNANLVKKTRFPRFVLPLSIVVANLINFLLSLVVLFAFLLILGYGIPKSVVWLPLVIAIEFFLCLGLSLFVACTHVYFKDIQHLLSVGLLAWFFLTPIIYPISIIPERFLKWFLFNPMASLVGLYRQVFLETEPVPILGLYLCLGVTIAFFVMGVVSFRRFEPNFADEL